MKKQQTVTTSIRMAEATNEYIKNKSSEIGISQNAFTLILIELGKKAFEGSPDVNAPK